MNAQHTPGPWHCGLFRETGDAPGIDIGAHNNANVAIAHHDASDRDPQETKANARLIAAAPEMYAALYDLERYLRGTSHHNAMQAAYARRVLGRIDFDG